MALVDSALLRDVEDALDAVWDLVAEDGLTLEAGLEAFEEALRDHLNAVGRAAMTLALEACDPKDKHLPDGRVCVLEAEHRYMTLFGAVTPRRGRYRLGRSGPTDCPMETRADIIAGFWTPLAAKAALVAVAELPPRRVVALLNILLGASASHSSLDRLPKAIQALYAPHRLEMERDLRAQESVPVEAATVVVSLDGVMVATRGNTRAEQKEEARKKNIRDAGPNGHRESMCATVTLYDAEGERLVTRRQGRMPEKGWPTIKAWVEAELEEVRHTHPDLLVMAAADGSRGLWGYLPTLNADEEYVDFYHAAEYLKDAMDALMGANKSTTDTRYAELRHILRYERFGVSQVRGALEDLEAQRKTRMRPRRGARFFRTHEQRMAYAELDAQNLPIGTGVMEGTCKSLVTDRLKRAGMRWSQTGGQAILTLRALVQSERFERAWRWMRDHRRAAAA